MDAIVAWLRALPELGTAARRERTPPRSGFAERPVRFGADHNLFGILTPAAEPSPPDRPPIVLLPAGAVNRSGPHRLYVTMARRWANLGFTVLRVDLSGIGDTPARPGERESLVYPRTGLNDIGEALDFLAGETGASRFILVGLCSGADLAYQAARREERLAGVVMMNPRTFLDLDLTRVEQPPPRPPRESDAVEIEEALRVPAGLRQISDRGRGRPAGRERTRSGHRLRRSACGGRDARGRGTSAVPAGGRSGNRPHLHHRRFPAAGHRSGDGRIPPPPPVAALTRYVRAATGRRGHRFRRARCV